MVPARIRSLSAQNQPHQPRPPFRLRVSRPPVSVFTRTNSRPSIFLFIEISSLRETPCYQKPPHSSSTIKTNPDRSQLPFVRVTTANKFCHGRDWNCVHSSQQSGVQRTRFTALPPSLPLLVHPHRFQTRSPPSCGQLSSDPTVINSHRDSTPVTNIVAFLNSTISTTRP